jgi:hypothetical protein
MFRLTTDLDNESTSPLSNDTTNHYFTGFVGSPFNKVKVSVVQCL